MHIHSVLVVVEEVPLAQGGKAFEDSSLVGVQVGGVEVVSRNHLSQVLLGVVVLEQCLSQNHCYV